MGNGVKRAHSVAQSDRRVRACTASRGAKASLHTTTHPVTKKRLGLTSGKHRRSAASKKARRRIGLPRCSAPRQQDLLSLVGPAQESDVMHQTRHCDAAIARVCPRCIFIRRRASLPRWCAGKPQWMSGAWGVGCIQCAAGRRCDAVHDKRRQLISTNRQQGFCKQAIARNWHWSNYEVRGFHSSRGLSASIEMHGGTDGHKLAHDIFHTQQAHLSAGVHRSSDPRGAAASRTSMAMSAIGQCNNAPTRPLVCHSSPSLPDKMVRHIEDTKQTAREPNTIGSIMDPFRGRVPPQQDWIDVWADSNSCISSHIDHFAQINDWVLCRASCQPDVHNLLYDNIMQTYFFEARPHSRPLRPFAERDPASSRHFAAEVFSSRQKPMMVHYAKVSMIS